MPALAARGGGAAAALKARSDEAKALRDKRTKAVGKAGEVTTADGAVEHELVDQMRYPRARLAPE